MIRIALMGYARSGKDTVAEFITDYLEPKGHGYTRRMAFGDVLKARFHDAFPEIPEDPKPREGYEKFGQLGRDLKPTMWIDSLAVELAGWTGLYKNFVISDLRQPNEAQWCRENGFIIIQVWSPDKMREVRSGNDTTFNSVNTSEKNLHLIDSDYTIYNITNLEDLEEQVEEVLEAIIHEKSINRGNEKSN
jgi:hypothetical protein